MSAVTVSNVRLVTEKDRGASAGLFAVDVSLADGRVFPDALTVSMSAKHLRVAGGSDDWCSLCPPEVSHDVLEAAETAALEAVRGAAVTWPLAKTLRTPSRLAAPDDKGRVAIEWELECPHCGALDWAHIEERGSWGVLRCQQGHLSKVAILERNGERLFTEQVR